MFERSVAEREESWFWGLPRRGLGLRGFGVWGVWVLWAVSVI